jgi:RES domain-containing protein
VRMLEEILTVSLVGRYWRMISPKWAYHPLSGKGAARNGARYNPNGIEALYLSEDCETAIAEYHQDLIRPGTLCPYDLKIDRIVDLTDGNVLRELGIDFSILFSSWEKAVSLDQIPPTWSLYTELHSKKIKGLKYPSVQRKGGKNIVLWNWNNLEVRVFDPLSDLPKDDSSWRKN